MYHSQVMKRLMREVGLAVIAEAPRVGLAHTLLVCVRGRG